MAGGTGGGERHRRRRGGGRELTDAGAREGQERAGREAQLHKLHGGPGAACHAGLCAVCAAERCLKRVLFVGTAGALQANQARLGGSRPAGGSTPCGRLGGGACRHRAGPREAVNPPCCIGLPGPGGWTTALHTAASQGVSPAGAAVAHPLPGPTALVPGCRGGCLSGCCLVHNAAHSLQRGFRKAQPRGCGSSQLHSGMPASAPMTLRCTCGGGRRPGSGDSRLHSRKPGPPR